MFNDLISMSSASHLQGGCIAEEQGHQCPMGSLYHLPCPAAQSQVQLLHVLASSFQAELKPTGWMRAAYLRCLGVPLLLKT